MLPAPVAEPVKAPPLPVDEDHVYNFVEQMPGWPDHSGSLIEKLTHSIRSRLVLPRDVKEGHVFLRFEVDKAGNVRNLRVVKGLNASTDSAVLVAAKQLPQLIAGRQKGKRVIVTLSTEIVVAKPQAREVRMGKQRPHTPPTLTGYAYVDQPAHLPGGDIQTLEQTLVRNFRYPAGVQASQVNGMLYVEIVVTRAGKLKTIEVERNNSSKTVPAAIDKAVRATLNQLPTWVPARLAGESVASKLHITWSFSRSFSDGNTHIKVAVEQPKTTRDFETSDLKGL